MSSLPYLQIIVEALFFVVIAALLYQLNRRMARKPENDRATIEEFRRLMNESQASADLFSKTVQESEERLNRLARQLDNREKKIVLLIEKAESLIQQMSAQKAAEESMDSGSERYGRIMRMIQQGLSREEVASRLKVTLGEIDLIVELERARKAVRQGDLPEEGRSPTGRTSG